MPYPPELKELIKVVEQTRSERVGRKEHDIEVPFMSLEERGQILKYHPDYNEDGKRALRVGPNKGYRIAHEFADVLEAASRVDPDKIDLTKPAYETDLLVIGAGGAGTSAALIASERGAKVLMTTKLRHGDANTMMAEGGIQAATQHHKDSPYYHYLDVMGGGHFTNTPELVETLVTKAPSAIKWLEELGTNFSKDTDGTLMTIHGGGTSRKRMHSAADITGAEIMRTLRDEARNRPGTITVLEFRPAVELVLDAEGRCAGAVLYNLETEEYFLVKAKAVVIATGGSGRLHIQKFMTTNHYGATADGIVMAYRAGVEVCFLHTVQYHPTGVIFPEQAEGILITEKFRGAGAHILNVKGEQFVNEREPRDVEASALIREVHRGLGVPTPTGKFGIWLDSPMIDQMVGPGTVEKEFPGKFILYKRFGIDISKEPMLIYPTLHYQNGGLKIDKTTKTSLPGLYVAGEAAGGIHGENRLMGNSLLDIVVFGRIAGEHAAAYAKALGETKAPLQLDHVRRYNKEVLETKAGEGRIAPMLLPDYTLAQVKDRQLTSHYHGTLR